MTSGRKVREAFQDGNGIFPSGVMGWKTPPFDMPKLHISVVTGAKSTLQNLVWCPDNFTSGRHGWECGKGNNMSTHLRFQERNMESGMNTRMRRKCQSICHLTHMSHNLIRPVITRGQFGAMVRAHRSLAIWLETKEDPITNLKLTLRTFGSGILPHSFLS